MPAVAFYKRGEEKGRRRMMMKMGHDDEAVSALLSFFFSSSSRAFVAGRKTTQRDRTPGNNKIKYHLLWHHDSKRLLTTRMAITGTGTSNVMGGRRK